MRCVLSGGVPFLKACPSRRCALPGGGPRGVPKGVPRSGGVSFLKACPSRKNVKVVSFKFKYCNFYIIIQALE